MHAVQRRVSIVTPSFNAGGYLRATVDSVLSQTFEQWEHVIVDDGSTDGSVAAIHTCLREDSRFRFVTQVNGGVARARNNGYRSSDPKTDLVIFLDADDVLEPDALSAMVDYLDLEPAAGIVYSDCSFVDGEGAFLADTREYDWWRERYVLRACRMVRLRADEARTPFESIFMLPNLIPSNTMIRRSAYDRTTGWDESFGQPVEDTDLFLRIALSAEVHHIPDRLVRYRRHAAQSTAQQERLVSQTKRLYRKWAALATSDTANSRAIERAIMVREGFAVPQMWLSHGRHHLTAGHFLEGFKCYLRSVKFGGAYWARRAVSGRISST